MRNGPGATGDGEAGSLGEGVGELASTRRWETYGKCLILQTFG